MSIGFIQSPASRQRSGTSPRAAGLPPAALMPMTVAGKTIRRCSPSETATPPAAGDWNRHVSHAHPAGRGVEKTLSRHPGPALDEGHWLGPGRGWHQLLDSTGGDARPRGRVRLWQDDDRQAHPAPGAADRRPCVRRWERCPCAERRRPERVPDDGPGGLSGSPGLP